MYSIEENKRIARQWIELVSAHRVEEICAMTAPTWTMRDGPPNLPTGPDGVRALFRTIGPVDQTWTIEDVIAEGDKVVVRAINSCAQDSFFGIDGRGRQQTFSATFIHRIAGGQIQETWRNADVLARLSDRSHRLRYMLSWPRSAEALEREARRMLVGATGDYITLIVISHQHGHETALAVGELARDRANPTSGEIAIVVRDDVQGQGIGTLVGVQLMQAAGGLGITTIRADLLAENTASLRLIRRLGVPFRITPSRGAMQVVLSCEQAAGDEDARRG